MVLQIYKYEISHNYFAPSTFREFLEAPRQTTPHVKQMEYVVERLQSSEHLSVCQIKAFLLRGFAREINSEQSPLGCCDAWA